uniref:thioredoxin family protein n=1 Tax=Dialister sp. TaxID=1955814 RepID=UPI00402635BF
MQIDIAVSLSCNMCPDLVASAERIAADNDHVSVDVYDLAHYPDMQKKYSIMSVPCLIMDGKTYFGKKSLEELLQIIR